MLIPLAVVNGKVVPPQARAEATTSPVSANGTRRVHCARTSPFDRTHSPAHSRASGKVEPSPTAQYATLLRPTSLGPAFSGTSGANRYAAASWLMAKSGGGVGPHT